MAGSLNFEVFYRSEIHVKAWKSKHNQLLKKTEKQKTETPWL
jgi:hypothetical protein